MVPLNAFEALILEKELKKDPKYMDFLYEWSILWFKNMKSILNIDNISTLDSLQISFLAKNPNMHPIFLFEKVIIPHKNNAWLLSYNPNMTHDLWVDLQCEKKYRKYNHYFDFPHDFYIFTLQQERFEEYYLEMLDDYDTLVKKKYLKMMSEFPCVNIEFANSQPIYTFCHFLLAQNPIITFEDMSENPQYQWHTTCSFDPDWEEEDCKFNALILNPNITFDLLKKMKKCEFFTMYQGEKKIITLNEYNQFRLWQNSFTLIRVQFIQQKIILWNEERKNMLKELVMKAWDIDRYQDWCI